MQMCNEYIEALEEEHRKIQVFQRELPLCLELVTQAIEGCKRQLSHVVNKCYFQQEEDNDCYDQTSSHEPILEEFIPIKRPSSSGDDEGEEDESHKHNSDTEKSDWLKSVQLWNQSPKDNSPKNESVKQDDGALNKDVGTKTSATRAARDDRQRESKRKQRRCWSPELHRRFLNSLQQLGGAHVATPKQIRELMKVDGLSNDEVKSHLQKYRLHTRRPSSRTHNDNQQASQFVVVGGIWVQHSEYAKMGETSLSEEDTGGVITTDTDTYAVAAALPPSRPHRSKHSYSEENGSHSTSSSTQTTTTSRVVNLSHHGIAKVM